MGPVVHRPCNTSSEPWLLSVCGVSSSNRVPLFGQMEGHSQHARILDYPTDHEAARQQHGSMCWMCGNWTEVKFEWVRGE